MPYHLSSSGRDGGDRIGACGRLQAADERSMRFMWRLTSSRNPSSKRKELANARFKKPLAALCERGARGNFRNSRRLGTVLRSGKHETSTAYALPCVPHA